MQTIKKLLDSKGLELSIVLLSSLLGVVLALGYINTSSASQLEGEIDISFVNSHDRPANRLVVEGDFIAIVYYRGEIVEGEETICNPVRKARFDLMPPTGYDIDGTKIFNQYTEADKVFYVNNDRYDYVCFMVLWGTWDDNTGISYGPYKMGSDVTADNYDDLLEQTEEVEEVVEEEEEEESTPDNPPVLRVSHNNTTLSVTATDDNLNLDSWQNAGPLAADPNCEAEDLTYNPAGSDQHSLTLTTADNGQWYCFKVSDTGSNTSYIKHQVTGVVIEEETVNNEVDNGADPGAGQQ